MNRKNVDFVLGFSELQQGDCFWNDTEFQSFHSSFVNSVDPGSTQISVLDNVETSSFADFAVSVAPVASTAVMGFAGAWVQAKYGRKVRIKRGDLEIEASSAEEVTSLLDKLT